MEFKYTEKLINYMKEKNKNIILVELVEINTSDIEIAELHVQFATEGQKKTFMEKKRYYSKEAPYGEIILPPFPLQYSDEITFDLKKVLWFHMISYKGIKVSVAF